MFKRRISFNTASTKPSSFLNYIIFNPMFFFLSLLIANSITIHYPQSQSLVIEEDVIENQICTGFFQPKDAINTSYEVMILSPNEEVLYFHKEGIPNAETHFSFNITDAENLLVEIKAKPTNEEISHVPNKIAYKFESDFDTFNKDVAKNVRVEPAVEALISLEKLLYEAYIQTQARTVKLQTLTRQHGMMVRYVTFVSIVTLILVTLFNAYQIYAMKKFFKKKKLI